jgi:hypothetical protein
MKGKGSKMYYREKSVRVPKEQGGDAIYKAWAEVTEEEERD